MITIGKITRPHGVEGEVKVLPMTDFPERFCHLKQVTLANGAGDERVVGVERAKCTRDNIFLKLKGIDTAQEAERLRHMFLLVQPSEAFPLPKDRYYIFDLIGLDVITDLGTGVGRVKDVMQLKSNDVYVVQSERGEVLIPATKQIVREIDLRGGKMIIHPVRGLLA